MIRIRNTQNSIGTYYGPYITASFQGPWQGLDSLSQDTSRNHSGGFPASIPALTWASSSNSHNMKEEHQVGLASGGVDLDEARRLFSAAHY